MRSKIFFSLAISLFIFAADAKPFKRVVVFSGGGFQFAQFLGMMEALEDSNMKPDLIVASCGGSLAATIIANLPTPEQRREFIFSTKLKKLLRSARPLDIVDSALSGYQFLLRRKLEAEDNLVPNVFNEYLIQIPNELPNPEFNIPFSSSSIPIIIVAGKVLFNSGEVGKGIKNKLFREVLFTSPSVATYLQGARSAVALSMPDSSIETEAEVNTTFTVNEAARAAITNPMVLPPTLIDGHYYVGGSVDLYPLELARALGDEVIMSFGDGYGDSASVPVVKAAYQFDPNRRLKYVNDQYADWWVDASDRETYLEEKFGFGLKNDFLSTFYRMPENDEQFEADVWQHFTYGKKRMLEALEQNSRNHKCHVRYLDERNSSPAIRKTCGRS